MARRKIKRHRGAAWTPKVKTRKDRGTWLVDCGYAFGKDKRLRRHFMTEAEALEWAALKAKEYAELLLQRKAADKASAVIQLANLTDTQRNNLLAALATVGGDYLRLLRAAEFFMKHAGAANASRALAEVSKEYIEAKTVSGRRPDTIKDAQVKVTPFVEAHKTAQVHEVTTADVERWLNGRGFTNGTREAYRRALVGLFSYAVRRRYTEYNPAAAIERLVIDQSTPEIHSLDEVRRVLDAAKNYTPQRYIVLSRKPMRGQSRPVTDPATVHEARAAIVPYLAIGYFAGLRPENELANLDWKDIDFEARTIRVSPATAKKRRQRYVDMSENLLAWLTPYAKRAGKVGFSRFALRAVRKAAKVTWQKDVMRHSFGSYHLAAHEDAAKTSLQMGHMRADVLFNHYRNLVKKSAATEYWAIIPECQPNVLQFPVPKAG